MMLAQAPPRRGTRASRVQPWLACVVLSFAALLIHGYHPYAEDAGIYIPAVKKQLDPSLYPGRSEFFSLPAQWSVFTKSIAESARVSHLPLTYVLLLWYTACLFFTLVACWRIAEWVFQDGRAGLLAASLVALTLTMPAAGCALLLSDPYVTSRSVATPLILVSILCLLRGRYLYCGLCWLAAFAFHPLMAVIAALLLILLLMVRSTKRKQYVPTLAVLFVGAILVTSLARLPVNAEYRSAVLSRSYFFLNQWAWYELAGAVAPLAFFAWLAWKHREHPTSTKFQISLATTLFGVFAVAGAVAVTWIPDLFSFARFQPMRAFQLIYFIFLLLPVTAALRAISAPWERTQRKLACSALLALIASGMFVVQRATFPSSSHIEWPWRESQNAWQQAFEWIRLNTPKDAIFALDPDYPNSPGNDRQGFRAEAERSALPDWAKDGGIAALFPQVAREWRASTLLTAQLDHVENERAQQLRNAGVTWILVQRGSASQFDCPYSNAVVSVCRLAGPAMFDGLKSASVRRP
jgi:hypothetical protein